jgi:hypothetical protein
MAMLNRVVAGVVGRTRSRCSSARNRPTNDPPRLAIPRGTFQSAKVAPFQTGDTAHWVRLEGMVTELYDVVAQPSVRRPTVFGFKYDEIQRTSSIGDEGKL